MASSSNLLSSSSVTDGDRFPINIVVLFKLDGSYNVVFMLGGVTVVCVASNFCNVYKGKGVRETESKL